MFRTLRKNFKKTSTFSFSTSTNQSTASPSLCGLEPACKQSIGFTTLAILTVLGLLSPCSSQGKSAAKQSPQNGHKISSPVRAPQSETSKSEGPSNKLQGDPSKPKREELKVENENAADMDLDYGEYNEPSLFSPFTNARKTISGFTIRPMVFSLTMTTSSKTEGNQPIQSDPEKYDEGMGIGLGYVSIPRRGSGYDFFLNYGVLKQEKYKNYQTHLLQLESNWQYSLFPRLSFRLGGHLAVMDVVDPNGNSINETLKETPGFGGQVGIGLFLTQRIAINLNYQHTLWSFETGTSPTTTTDYVINGTNASLSFTF